MVMQAAVRFLCRAPPRLPVRVASIATVRRSCDRTTSLPMLAAEGSLWRGPSFLQTMSASRPVGIAIKSKRGSHATTSSMMAAPVFLGDRPPCFPPRKSSITIKRRWRWRRCCVRWLQRCIPRTSSATVAAAPCLFFQRPPHNPINEACITIVRRRCCRHDDWTTTPSMCTTPSFFCRLTSQSPNSKNQRYSRTALMLWASLLEAVVQAVSGNHGLHEHSTRTSWDSAILSPKS